MKRYWISDEEADKLLEKAEKQFQSVFGLYIGSCREFYEKRDVTYWSDSLFDLFRFTNHILSISPKANCYSDICRHIGSEDMFKEIRNMAFDRLSDVNEEDVNKFLATIPFHTFFSGFSEVLTHDLQEDHNIEEMLISMAYGLDLTDMLIEFCRQFDIGDDYSICWQRGYCKLGFDACWNMAIYHWYAWLPIFPTIMALDILTNCSKRFHELFWKMATWIVKCDPRNLTSEEDKIVRLLLETKLSSECFEQLVKSAEEINGII